MHGADQSAAMAERAAGWPRAGCFCCSATRWTIIRRGAVERAPARALCIHYSATARRRAGGRGFVPRMAHGISDSTAARRCWLQRGAGVRRDRRQGAWWNSFSPTMPAPASRPPVPSATSEHRAPVPRECMTGSSRAVRREHGTRVRRSLPCGRAVAPGGRGLHAPARGGRRLTAAKEACACREQTSRSSTRHAARRPPPGCRLAVRDGPAGRGRAAIPEVEAAGGRWVDTERFQLPLP
jgi:hypothetical protein